MVVLGGAKEYKSDPEPFLPINYYAQQLHSFKTNNALLIPLYDFLGQLNSSGHYKKGGKNYDYG